MKKISFALLLCSSFIAGGQSPQLTIVQAANQPATTAPAVPATQATTAAGGSTESATVLKLLQEMKTTNEETLKKQQATLERLDELEKAAEQIKIFAHRG